MKVYSYRLEIDNPERVQVEVYQPNGDLRGEPEGKLHCDEKTLHELQALHKQAAAGELQQQDVRRLGDLLFETLFDERLRLHFFTCYEEARQIDGFLRVELDIDERRLPHLAALPWEFMHVPALGPYNSLWLATDPHVVFSRRRKRWTAAAPIQLDADERLRIGLAVAAPNDLPPVRFEKIQQTLQELAAHNPQQIEFLPLVNAATPQALDELLAQQPHILHFIGHGQLKTESGRSSGQIALVYDDGAANWRSAQRFGDLFARHRPGAVLLQACEGGASDSSEAFSSVASQIIEQNIAVVIAMQYEISNNTARRFALSFYQQLAQNNPVDKAVQEGRLQISLSPKDYQTRDFATPLLYMRVKDGRLFHSPGEEKTQNFSEDPNRFITYVGGSYIAGNVNVSGGDFVGGNKSSEPVKGAEIGNKLDQRRSLQQRLITLCKEYELVRQTLDNSTSKDDSFRLLQQLSAMQDEMAAIEDEIDSL